MENQITVTKNEAIILDQQIKNYVKMAWQNLVESAKCLKKMRDTKLYIELGYETFEDYTVNSLGIKERQAYTYISTLEKVGEPFLQLNAGIGITKLSLLSTISPMDREELVENNDIAAMSVEEVKKLVSENDAKGEQISMLNEEIANKDEIISELEAELNAEKSKPTEVAVQELSNTDLEKIKADARKEAEAGYQKELKAQLKSQEKAIKEKLSAENSQAIQKAQADSTKKLAEAEKKAEEYRQQINVINSEKKAAEARAEQLAKKMQVTASPETVKFTFYFDALQGDYNKLISSIKNIAANDKPAAEKFKVAMLKYCDIMKNGIDEVLADGE